MKIFTFLYKNESDLAEWQKLKSQFQGDHCFMEQSLASSADLIRYYNIVVSRNEPILVVADDKESEYFTGLNKISNMLNIIN